MGKHSKPEEAHRQGQRGPLGVALSWAFGIALLLIFAAGIANSGESAFENGKVLAAFGAVNWAMASLDETRWPWRSEVTRGVWRVLLPLWVALTVGGLLLIGAATLLNW